MSTKKPKVKKVKLPPSLTQPPAPPPLSPTTSRSLVDGGEQGAATGAAQAGSFRAFEFAPRLAELGQRRREGRASLIGGS